MPIYKRCLWCGGRVPSGTTCPCREKARKINYREYDRNQRDRKSYDFYHSTEWQRTREQILMLDDWIDVYLAVTQGIVVAADTVHHIVPLKDDWAKRFEPDNLISLHHDTHTMIEKKYGTEKDAMIGKLTAMLAYYRTGR